MCDPEISVLGQVLSPEKLWRDRPHLCRDRAPQSAPLAEFSLNRHEDSGAEPPALS